MNEKKYELNYNEKLDATTLKFLDRCDPDEFREAYTQMLELFKSQSCYKHITDTSKMGVVSVENQKWVGKEIVGNMKAAVPAGKKLHVGLVLGNDIFATVAAKNIERISEEERIMIVEEFPTIVDAESWIVTV